MSDRIYAFHCGGIRTYRGVYDVKDERPTESVYEPAFFFLVDLGGRRILFDTGMNARYIREDDGSFGVIMAAEDTLSSRLATLGLTPSDIEAVVVSHLHSDHAGGLEYLDTDTPVYVSARELTFASEPAPYQRLFYDSQDFSRNTHWVEVGGELDVFGDGRLLIIPAPGHTPGHQVLKVQLAARVIVLCGDASYLEEKMRARRMPGIVWNPDELLRTWTLLEEIEQTDAATLVFTHALDFRESRPLAPGAWYE